MEFEPSRKRTAPVWSTDRLHLRSLRDRRRGLSPRARQRAGIPPPHRRPPGSIHRRRSFATSRNARCNLYAERGYGMYRIEERAGRNPSRYVWPRLIATGSTSPNSGSHSWPAQSDVGSPRRRPQGVLAYAEHELALKRIVAIVSPDNPASIRVLEKTGFVFSKTIPWPEDGSDLSFYTRESQGPARRDRRSGLERSRRSPDREPPPEERSGP